MSDNFIEKDFFGFNADDAAEIYLKVARARNQILEIVENIQPISDTLSKCKELDFSQIESYYQTTFANNSLTSNLDSLLGHIEEITNQLYVLDHNGDLFSKDDEIKEKSNEDGSKYYEVNNGTSKTSIEIYDDYGNKYTSYTDFLMHSNKDGIENFNNDFNDDKYDIVPYYSTIVTLGFDSDEDAVCRYTDVIEDRVWRDSKGNILVKDENGERFDASNPLGIKVHQLDVKTGKITEATLASSDSSIGFEHNGLEASDKDKFWAVAGKDSNKAQLSTSAGFSAEVSGEIGIDWTGYSRSETKEYFNDNGTLKKKKECKQIFGNVHAKGSLDACLNVDFERLLANAESKGKEGENRPKYNKNSDGTDINRKNLDVSPDIHIKAEIEVGACLYEIKGGVTWYDSNGALMNSSENISYDAKLLNITAKAYGEIDFDQIIASANGEKNDSDHGAFNAGASITVDLLDAQFAGSTTILGYKVDGSLRVQVGFEASIDIGSILGNTAGKTDAKDLQKPFVGCRIKTTGDIDIVDEDKIKNVYTERSKNLEGSKFNDYEVQGNEVFIKKAEYDEDGSFAGYSLIKNDDLYYNEETGRIYSKTDYDHYLDESGYHKRKFIRRDDDPTGKVYDKDTGEQVPQLRVNPNEEPDENGKKSTYRGQYDWDAIDYIAKNENYIKSEHEKYAEEHDPWARRARECEETLNSIDWTGVP